MRIKTVTGLFALFVVLCTPANGQTIFPGETGTQLISSLQSTYTPSSVLNINDSRDTLFGVLHLGPGNVVTGVYTGMTLTLDTNADPNTDALAKGMNTEHTLPQSVGATEGTQAHADLHNLYPTRIEANSARLNFPLGEIDDDDTDVWFCGEQELTTKPDISIIDTCSELDNDTETFEPREDQKGNAARSIFYMFTIYESQMDRTYFAEQKAALQAWHDADPVDAAEETRSDMIATYQDGKVNPFIEDDTLVDRAFFTPNNGDASISELRIDQPGDDTDEYFELYGSADTELTGLTYLVVGDGIGGSGVIEHATDLSGLILSATGYFLAAEETFTLATADITTELNFENSDNVTHMLVEDFSGRVNQDLDTNDDGSFDISPWGVIRKCIALLETVGSGDLTYCGATIGPDGSNVPGHVYKDGGDWAYGAFDPVGQDDTPGYDNSLPVELVDFRVRIDGLEAVLSWTTLSENGNAGFDVELFDRDNVQWQTEAFISGAGTSTVQQQYSYRTQALASGRHKFRLRQIDFDGSFEYSDVVEIEILPGAVYELASAFPNPFSESTTIAITVLIGQEIEAALYNVLGQEVLPLYSGPIGSNERREFTIDGSSLTSGIYIYRIEGEDFSLARQVTLIR